MKAGCIIGIAGGSGAGKSFLAKKLVDRFGESRSVILSQDCYYFGKTEDDIINRRVINFDHPDSVDFQWFIETVRQLSSGRKAECPVYSMECHQRLEQKREIEPKEILIIEGTLIFSSEELRELCHVRIFLDLPEKFRLDRRILRDLKERRRKIYDIMGQFRNSVQPMHWEFVEPQKQRAHAVIHAESLTDEHIQQAEDTIFNLCPGLR